MESEIVVELEIVKVNGEWYRKGLDMKGSECWEVLDDESEVYSDNWIEDSIKEVMNEL
jgi:hypothetical protein